MLFTVFINCISVRLKSRALDVVLIIRLLDVFLC